MNHRLNLRNWIFFVALFVLVGLASLPLRVLAAASAPQVTVNASQAAPRPVEDTTVQAITRDYTAAWKSLAQALDENRAGLLNANFVGAAREQFGQVIAGQQKNGLHQRIVDHGHKVQVVFYSADGSALQVQDTAQLEIQYLDGGSVVKSEQTTINYVALLTPAENSWKVRLLQATPGF